MAARPYWKGHMRLSLVTFPVQLYTAIETKERITFHQIHKPTGERIRYQKIVPDIGPVPADDIVKGYEFEKNAYVLIEEEELETLRLESNHTIELVQFASADEIDAIYFERPYYVVPQPGIGEEAFAVIRDALRRARKVALGQIVLANRERIAAIKPCGKGLVLETLRYAEEVREVDEYFDDIAKVDADQDQLDLAEQLIKRRTKPFDPEAFKDHYQQALRELVKAKVEGRPAQPTERPASGNVIDLTEALRQSLGKLRGESAAAARAKPTPGTAKAGKGKGKAGDANAKKPAAARKPERPDKKAGNTKAGSSRRRSTAA